MTFQQSYAEEFDKKLCHVTSLQSNSEFQQSTKLIPWLTNKETPIISRKVINHRKIQSEIKERSERVVKQISGAYRNGSRNPNLSTAHLLICSKNQCLPKVRTASPFALMLQE